MRRRNRLLVIFLTIFLCIGCDQVTKSLAALHLPKSKALSFAGDTLRLDYNVNKGAVLTFEHSVPERYRGRAFSTGVSLFVGLAIMALLLTPSVSTFSAVSLSLFCGGILSNLLDRLTMGNVVDFLNVGWGSFRTCIFNVADAAISIGFVLFAAGIAWNVILFGASASRLQSTR